MRRRCRGERRLDQFFHTRGRLVGIKRDDAVRPIDHHRAVLHAGLDPHQHRTGVGVRGAHFFDARLQSRGEFLGQTARPRRG